MDNVKSREVKGFRLTVYRSWGQIAVKEIDGGTLTEAENYARSTWRDIWKLKIKLIR